MKNSCFLFVLLIFVSACNKNSSKPETEPQPPPDTTNSALRAHTWLFDSLKTFYNGVFDGEIISGNPKIEMWFTADSMYFNIPGGPQEDVFVYEVKDGNKLYRWRPGNPEDEYFIIQALTDKRITLSTHDQVEITYDYYSAKP